MAWITLTTDDVLSEFTPNEAAAIRNLQGGSGSGPPYANIDIITARSVDEVRGYIMGGGYSVDQTDDTTVPRALFADTIAIARWRVLISAPQLRQLQTDERRKAFDDAIAKLNKIVDQQFSIEPPIPETGIQTGTWNSENKLIMRTHPVPQPSVQGTETSTDWANSGLQPPVPVAGALYNPYIVALRDDANSLEALPTTRLGTNQLLIIVIAESQSVWQLVVGTSDTDNPDGEVQPLDYDAGTNNRHWLKVGGL